MVLIKKIGNEFPIDQILNKYFLSPVRSGYVEVGEEKICLPVGFEEYEGRLRNFEVHNDDVYILGHPKTGTSWAQEMIWLLINNLDYDKALNDKTLIFRHLHLELAALFDMEKLFATLSMPHRNILKEIENAERPRCIKSHLHWSLLPDQLQFGVKQPKIIITLRNPGDTCISHYYHSVNLDNYTGSFEDFCELFLEGRVFFGPFWKQVLSCWEQKDRSNVLIIRYEEMKTNFQETIKKVANFLEKDYVEEQLTKLGDYLGFENMKKNPSTNRNATVEFFQKNGLSGGGHSFIRKGEIGEHEKVMSPELIKRFENYTKEYLEKKGLNF